MTLCVVGHLERQPWIGALFKSSGGEATAAWIVEFRGKDISVWLDGIPTFLATGCDSRHADWLGLPTTADDPAVVGYSGRLPPVFAANISLKLSNDRPASASQCVHGSRAASG